MVVYALAAAALLLWFARPLPGPSPAPRTAAGPAVVRQSVSPSAGAPAFPEAPAARATPADPELLAPEPPAGARPQEPAEPKPPPLSGLDRGFRDAAREFDLPEDLLRAIALHESRANPWALNFDGQGFFPESKQKALDLLKSRRPESYDVGLMQINNAWLEKFGVAPAEALEPAKNINLGAWVLKQCVKEHGLGWDALAAYHTGKPGKGHWRASVYALKVWTRYEKLKNSRP